MSTSVWLIPAFPLAGALINFLFGRFIGRHAHWVAVPALAASFVAACRAFAYLWNGGPADVQLFPWIVAGDFETWVTAHVDQLTGVMLLVVTGVGALIHVYSVGYMHGDSGYARYFAYLNLFVFSMTMLVLAGNFLLLYVFWEAVGLCSYLLIGFWYTRAAAAQAGKKAFIVNRVGDFGFGLAIMWLWTALGTLDYGEVFKRVGELSPATATGIALLLFVGACGKSAQLPLHTWLPDAMEGPTPVSALIHATELGHIDGSTALYWIATATAGLTGFYVFRMIFMTFIGDRRGETVQHRQAEAHVPHESPLPMLLPLGILAVAASIAIHVIGSLAPRPPIFRRSVSPPRACMTEPAPRNRQALKKAWVTRWNIPAAVAPTPKPRNM